IRHYKGLDILIEALARLRKEDPNYMLIVAGESYEDINQYSRQIDQLGLKDHVQLHNLFIPNEAVAPYFVASDLVVLPYRSATQSGILNMAYGFDKPVLITDVGGLSEFVDEGKTGIIVDEPTPEVIASGIRSFYASKNEIDYAVHIRERVAGNSFDHIQEVFMEIYEVLH
ncbi:MAG TPA: glycosyltransferase, partial [Saprospiraceae bacterium]|nr:glycosyltransferase [Saprospiraceae bacterium]